MLVFGESEGVDFCCCCRQCVPVKFSMGSQHVPQVPNVFPNVFPIAPHLIPSALSKVLHFSFEALHGARGYTIVVKLSS
jgi:hypothetical protein